MRNNKFLQTALAILITLYSNTLLATAGYIVKDATISSVANTFGTGDNFIVNAAGGSTNKCLGVNIWFKLETVSFQTIHARAYSTALTAYTSGSKVNIWSNDGTCEGAYHIQVKK